MTGGASDLLADLRVIDCSTEIAGPYATKLFADAGADVIKLEPPEGDPFRRRAPLGEDLKGDDAALFRYLNAGKRSVVGHDAAVQRLLAGADLVVHSQDRELDVQALRARWPHIVVLSLSAYGMTGPYAGRPATTFVVEAESGALSSRGLPDGVPYQAGGRLMDWAHGSFAAVGALAAVTRARRTGHGEHVDAPLIVAANFAGVGGRETMYVVAGDAPRTTPARSEEVPSVEPTRDGWVGFNTNTHQQFRDFVTMVGHPELAEEGDWTVLEQRASNIEEWNGYVRPWMRERTTDEVVELAALLRIPVAPVNDGAGALRHEHFRARGVLGRSADGGFEQPLPPALVDGKRPGIAGRAPRLGEHAGAVEDRSTPSPQVVGQPRQLPFAGLRVLDATAWWAGPSVGYLFASLGADVIHLESIQRPDGMRLAVAPVHRGAPQWWERSGLALATNGNKRNVTLSLADEGGLELIERLIARCDVVVENYSPRVFDRFGLTAERVRELNPQTVFLRMPAFGLDGPWRDHVGFAQTMEQITGFAWLTGHPDDQPRIPRGPCDPVAGFHGAFAAIAALHRRDRDGVGGAFVESAFVEAILNCAGEAIVAWSAYGVELERSGNRSAEAAPQGLYRCRGLEQWLALSVVTDEQWFALERVLGEPDWAGSPALETHAGRQAAHDRIDAELAAWAADRELGELVDELVAAGIPAGALADYRNCREHPQLAAIGHFERVEHPVVGEYPAPGLPFTYASVERWVRRRAPLLGEDNMAVLAELLGLSPDEVERLEREQLIGSQPIGT